MTDAEQQQLSDEQWARLATHTGCARSDVEALMRGLQSPSVTRAQQLACVGYLTGRSVHELTQCVRQRRQDAALRPCLVRLVARLRRLRDAPDARFVAQCRMSLAQALRLAALVERQREPDGYVYSATLRLLDQSARRHELSVSWRHPAHRPALRCAELFGEDSGAAVDFDHQ